MLNFKHGQDRNAFCQSWNDLNGQSNHRAKVQYLVIFNTDAFGLVHLADGTADYTADLQIVWDGFVGTNWTVLRSAVQFNLVKKMYFRVLDQVPVPDSLTYLLYSNGQSTDGLYWLRHFIAQPPTFEHVLQIRVIGGGNPSRFARPDAPRLVTFSRQDRMGQRLQQNDEVTGSITMEHNNGVPYDTDINFRVVKDLYAGESDNFVVLDEYCHFKDRFKWYLCPASYPN